ncbi:Predicted glycosyl transferase [Desulfonatronum thiosulfatophilum]|uniref:Predicted glycosyl transferase n=1 Tax=Desulfonatronum thiosulfatophilum TaxID=617002 RepID=A0A1G6AK26_9BACT|nr:glycosyltransferase [Desulfonatronum thiosulfatophilum]SDB08716.1 Predicted glycosyl transferase [Desulfonatronum thiosulfatophilum]
MHIVHYSQHVLGVGHLFRSLEIAKALAPHRVDLVTGGEHVPVDLPDHVRHVPLPALSMDGDFQRLLSTRSGHGGDDPDLIASIMDERRTRLLEHVRRVRPDIFLVELFPFGRKRFGFEILPVLKVLRAGEFGTCRAVCSVRDILVEKSDQDTFEQRVLNHLNTLFDLVLVHSDPSLVRLDETFSRVAEIVPELRYTGYVSLAVDPASGVALRRELGLAASDRLIVASAGGGAVGGNLLRAVVRASEQLHQRLPHRLQVFTGPFMEQSVAEELQYLAQSQGHIRIERFTNRFTAWLSAADLSVSMAGYNTTMNLLAAGARAMVLPFAQNREQSMRAQRLQRRGVMTVLKEDDLAPSVFSGLLHDALNRGLNGRRGLGHQCLDDGVLPVVNLNGAATTAEILVRFGVERQEHVVEAEVHAGKHSPQPDVA